MTNRRLWAQGRGLSATTRSLSRARSFPAFVFPARVSPARAKSVRVPVVLTLSGALTLGGVAALSGCSHDDSAPKPTPSAVSITTGVQEERVAPDIRSLTLKATELRNESSWGTPHVQLEWPNPEATPALSRALDKQVQQWRSDFGAEGYGDRPSLTVTWDPVANADGIIGVRLTSTTFAGADIGVASKTFYGDGSHSWDARGLLGTGSTTALRGTVQKAVAKKTKAGEQWETDPARVFTDITFDTNGDLLMHMSEGMMGPMSAGEILARVPNPEIYLSEAGKRVRAAAMKSPISVDAGTAPTEQLPPGPGSAGTPGVPTQPSGSNGSTSINCAVAQCVALTFDDSPGVHTEGVLQTLRAKNVKATFFMEGSAVTAAPVAVRQVKDAGMAIGAKPWGLSILTQRSREQVISDINRTKQALAKVGVAPVGLRPPYGLYDSTTPHAGLPFVLADVHPQEQATASADATVNAVLKSATSGSIVQLHENAPATQAALGEIIDGLRERGFTFVTVNQLVPQMDPGKVYRSRADVTR